MLYNNSIGFYSTMDVEYILLTIAILATAIFTIKLLVFALKTDSKGLITRFELFSADSILAAVACFGWMALIGVVQFGLPVFIALVLGLTCAVVIIPIAALLMFLVK